MLKKAILWMLAAVTTVGIVQFLIVLARTYGLPPAPAGAEVSPQSWIAMFGFVLISVGGADIVRYFVKAGIRSR